MRPGGFDDLAVPAEDLVAELEDAKIGPGPRTQADDFPQHLVGRPVGAGLRHDQDCRRRRAGYPGVAMDEKMRLVGHGEVARKGKQQLDVPALRRDPARLRFDHVVKSQPQSPVDIEPAQRIRLRPSGVEDREHMRHMSCAMALQLFDPANRDLEWRELIFGHHSYPSMGWRDARNIAWLWQFCARSSGPRSYHARARGRVRSAILHQRTATLVTR